MEVPGGLESPEWAEVARRAVELPTSSVPVLLDPPFAVAIVLLWAAIGGRVLRLLRADEKDAPALEFFVVSSAIGLGILQYFPFALGAAGALTRPALIVGLLLLGALFARDAARVLRVLRGGLRSLAGAEDRRWLHAALGIATIPLGLGLLAALCPPLDSDAQSYHLNAARRWLETGHLVALPTLTPTYWPMGLQMNFALAMGVFSDTSAQLLHYACGLLATCAVFALGRRVGGTVLAVLAAYAFLFAIPIRYFFALTMASGATIDLGVTFALLAAVLAWFVWRDNRRDGWFWASALCAGIAASFKLTGAFAGMALAALAFLEQRGTRRALPLALRSCTFVGVGFLFPLPWFVRSALLSGSPVYPLFGAVLGFSEWTPEFGVAFGEWYRLFNWGWTHAEWNARTRTLICVAGAGGLAAATALALRFTKRRELRTLILLVFALGSAAIATTGLYVRYMLPLLPLAYIVALAPLVTRYGQTRWLRAGTLSALLASSAVLLVDSRAKLRPALAAATSPAGRIAFLARGVKFFTFFEYLNGLRPDADPVLVGGLYPAFSDTGGTCYYSKRYCYVTDACLQQHVRLESWNGFVEDVKKLGVGYLVAPLSGRVNQLVMPDYAPARNELAFVRRLADEYGEVLMENGPVALYRLRLRGAPAAAR